MCGVLLENGNVFARYLFCSVLFHNAQGVQYEEKMKD